MSDDNVIHAFKPAELPEQTLAIEKHPPGKPIYCDHGSLRIDAFDRTIACAKCGQMLGPFDFLHKSAHVINRAWQDHASVRRDMSDMQDRVTALKKEEKRLKAMVKRLGDKTETVIDVRGKGVL